MVAIVMTSSAKPIGKHGTYRNVAVVDVAYWLAWDRGARPTMISTRAHGVLRIIRHYGRHNVGTTDRCAYRRAYRAASELAQQYNNAATYEDQAALVTFGGSA
jgi:hypothetical protein